VIFDMNLLIYAKRSCKPYSSLRFYGEGISRIAFIFAWSVVMPLCLMIKPRNFLDLTSDAHCSGFNFSWNFCYLSKNWAKIPRKPNLN